MPCRLVSEVVRLVLFIEEISSSKDFWIRLTGMFDDHWNRFLICSSSDSEYLGTEESCGRCGFRVLEGGEIWVLKAK